MQVRCPVPSCRMLYEFLRTTSLAARDAFLAYWHAGIPPKHTAKRAFAGYLR